MIKSRTVLLTVPYEGKNYYFRIKGISNVRFSLPFSVKTEQGIASNFVFPWFIGPVSITLKGETYIGTFNNVKDVLIEETSYPERKQRFTTPYSRTFNFFKRIFKKKKEGTKPEEDKYPRTQQFPFFLDKLCKISETIRTQQILDKEQTAHFLEISDYLKGKSIKFKGFISNVEVEESADTLGKLSFSIKFDGALTDQ